jgi:hypothetical protein
MMKLTGGGAPKDSHDAKVDYKLFAVTAPESPRVSGSAKASTGGVGIGSMLRVASFAGQMWLGGGMAFGVGGPMGMMTGLGAMSAMGDVSGGIPAFADPSEAEMRQTVSEALTNGAKAAIEHLTRKK